MRLKECEKSLWSSRKNSGAHAPQALSVFWQKLMSSYSLESHGRQRIILKIGRQGCRKSLVWLNKISMMEPERHSAWVMPLNNRRNCLEVAPIDKRIIGTDNIRVHISVWSVSQLFSCNNTLHLISSDCDPAGGGLKQLKAKSMSCVKTLWQLYYPWI